MILFVVFAPFAFGLLAYMLGRKSEKVRDIFVIEACFLELAAVLYVFFCGETFVRLFPGILAGGLSFRSIGFSRVYALVAALMWAFTAVFSKEYFEKERDNLNRYWFFMLATLGATEGVMLSADLMTCFLFFEILSFTSFTWVIHEETLQAVSAGYTYLFIAVTGGLVMFMGLAMLKDTAGTLFFDELPKAVAAAETGGRGKTVFAASVCILFGFGAKAGMFPLHVWLPKAHPAAPSPASALLSGILTKVGIYGILMTSLYVMSTNYNFGILVLVLGLITMLLGAILALLSINLKRTLACSSMSQIGFILTGIGMMVLLSCASEAEAAAIAQCGLMLHMLNHSLIKLTLFMAAGVVVMNIHALDLNCIRGFGRTRQFLKAAFALGALGISGVPFFSGYISKTLLHESIVEGIRAVSGLSAFLSVSEWIFLFTGGLTFAYMLKIFICVFIEKNSSTELQTRFDAQKRCMNLSSGAVIVISSLFMVLLGQPSAAKAASAIMSGKSEIYGFAAFSSENLKGGLISLAIGAAVYLLFVRKVLIRNGKYIDLWPKKLDLEDLVYRPLLTRLLPSVFGNIAVLFGENLVLRPVCRAVMFAGQVICRSFETVPDAIVLLLRKTILKERKVRGANVSHPGLIKTVAAELSESSRPVASNFTFALMMTCIGIVVVLCIIVFSVL